jgi:hypothetical protein
MNATRPLPAAPRRPRLTRLLCLLLLGACERITESPQRQAVGAELAGTFVRPTAVTTTGQGRLTATIEALSGEAVVEYSLQFSALVGNATGAHLHGPASATETGAILVNLAAPPTGSTGTITLGAKFGSASGTLDLRTAITPSVSGDSLHRLLDAGLVYVDIHTDSAGAGEIRGQILKR